MHGKLLRSLIVLLLVSAIVAVFHYWPRSEYHSHVALDAPGGLRLEFIQQNSPDRESCRALTDVVVSVALARCPECRIRQQECLVRLSSDLRDLLSEVAISSPSSRLRNGSIAYYHEDGKIALEACLQSQREILSRNPSMYFTCDPPQKSRSIRDASILSNVEPPAISTLTLRTTAILCIVLAIYLSVQFLSVSSPTVSEFSSNAAISIEFKWTNVIKRLIDIIVSVALLTLLFPIFVLVSILIYILEGYPIFYVSNRYISLGRSVTILKFRTMVRDANASKYRLQERFMRNGYLDIPLDCEVYTPIGRVLERAQIVELLQLFNIVFHGMSLIGNRPLPGGNVELLRGFDGWEDRFSSPAGLTGLSQIVGKLNQNPEERLELEKLYSKIYCEKSGNILLCDAYIVFYTIRLLLTGVPITFATAKRLVMISGVNRQD